MPRSVAPRALDQAAQQLRDQALLLRGAELSIVAVLALASIATLSPFQLAWPARFVIDLELRVSDVLLNLCMLAPLGFLLRLRFGVGTWSALLCGVVVSTSFEGAQLFVPGRCSSPIDVATNSLGCAIGCFLHARTAPRSEQLLLRLLKEPPTFEDSVWLGLVLLAVALAPLDLGGTTDWSSFHWTLGLAPLHREASDARALVIGLMASSCTGAWLGYTLAPRASLAVAGYVLLVVASIEVCRGFSSAHAASLASLMLATGCALLAARVRKAQTQRVWV